MTRRWRLPCSRRNHPVGCRAPRRNQRFTSLAQANTAIAAKLSVLNNRPFAKMDGTRAALFAQLARPAMRPLPVTRFEYATWKVAKVGIDYHVDVQRHYYSVPYQLAGQHVDVRVTGHTVEVFYRGNRIAAHPRSTTRGGHTTLPAHMPERHREHLAWTSERLTAWAARTGPATAELLTEIMASRAHPEQGYRSCLGIMRLSGRHEAARMEAASRGALAIGALSYRSFESILAHGRDQAPIPGQSPEPTPPRRYEQLRGADYYQ